MALPKLLQTMPVSPEREPRVVTVMREYREAMEARELGVLQDMANEWLKIEQQVNGNMAALQMRMAQLASEGKAITQQMIWKEQYYQQLKGQLADLIKGYNRDALIPIITKAQKEFGWFGVQAATDGIRASFITGISPYFPILNREAVETMAGFLGNGSPLNTLLKNDYPESLQGLTDALINGIGRGAGAGQIAQEMADGLGMGLDRAILIARTETNRTYRSAIVQEYRESNVVTGFRRLVKKETACMGCLFLDGEHFDLESELDDHPRGKCQAIPEVIGVEAPKWEKGKDWFLSLDPELQKQRMGEETYNFWKEGSFSLDQMVEKSHSDVWGDAPRTATLAELLLP